MMQLLMHSLVYENLALMHSGKEGPSTDLVSQTIMTGANNPRVVRLTNYTTMLWKEKSPT